MKSIVPSGFLRQVHAVSAMGELERAFALWRRDCTNPFTTLQREDHHHFRVLVVVDVENTTVPVHQQSVGVHGALPLIV